MRKLIIIDGNAIIHRAYHSTPPFKAASGQVVNAVYGFTSMLLTLIKNQLPDCLALTFDMKGPTFRHEEYSEYKATRTAAPDDLYAQIPLIKDIVKAFDIPIYELQGFEADDIIGTLALQAQDNSDIITYIVTGDRDTYQLVNDQVKIIVPDKGFATPKIIDREAVFERYQLTPHQIVDLKALQGDTSDNIKGVAGIGPKTATNLLQEYQSLENIYQNIDRIPGRIKEKLLQDQESAFLSKRLATIITDAPIKINFSACTFNPNPDLILGILQEFQFTSLIRRFNALPKHTVVSENQQTLF
ncbi:hypothetical protein CVV38_01110 [Candidatus Peregrinibacteria bacterium HGW-Peregrinibacteria-1]|nr:MAG: hypothetical protein CVV38_01110 [Candidatus Peregrinibacteria bacterium HGW-Peregrinibacteria-1]